MASLNALRYKTRNLYKQLLYIGKEYPLGHAYFKDKLKLAFLKKKDLQDPKEIEQAIMHGEYVYKELESLWFIKKYRAMRRNYANDEHDAKIRALLREYDR
ncbi:LYR motif-containing protein 5 [Batrachochytrium dendrobatidis]|nr:LYR motif-containing protein 5 [Batrachochytrium dendrobatidis]